LFQKNGKALPAELHQQMKVAKAALKASNEVLDALLQEVVATQADLSAFIETNRALSNELCQWWDDGCYIPR
jgi:hypothetical protein